MASSRYLLSLFLLCTGALASNDDSTITTSPPARRTPAPLVQRATTYETTTPLPLTDYNYPYSALPYQVNPYPVGRGPQSGYNVCNSTTEGADSECQTLIANTLSDFCIWGSPIANGQIGDVEAATVAYCTQPGHGTRLIPAGSITAAQFMKTSGYIQITGLFDQSGINLMANDTGGELDPHGADLFGNPLGGLVYSTGMPSGDNTTYKQVSSWNNFVGSGQFCIKLCDPTVTSPNYCKNEIDLIGCDYNMPASYAANEFTSCEGALQDVVGVYTSAGQTLTWAQPTDGIIPATLPWQPRVPASSNCVTYSSAQLFGTASASSASVTAIISSTTSASSASVIAAVSSTTSASGSSTSGSAATTKAGTSSSASSTATGSSGSSSNGAARLVMGSGVFVGLTATFTLLL